MKKILTFALIATALAVAVTTSQQKFDDPPPCWLWPQGCRG